jgi:hypothetical protein
MFRILMLAGAVLALAAGAHAETTLPAQPTAESRECPRTADGKITNRDTPTSERTGMRFDPYTGKVTLGPIPCTLI